MKHRISRKTTSILDIPIYGREIKEKKNDRMIDIQKWQIKYPVQRQIIKAIKALLMDVSIALYQIRDYSVRASDSQTTPITVEKKNSKERNASDQPTRIHVFFFMSLRFVGRPRPHIRYSISMSKGNYNEILRRPAHYVIAQTKQLRDVSGTTDAVFIYNGGWWGSIHSTLETYNRQHNKLL